MSALGDPMEAWKARGRELNGIYSALSRVVRDTIGDHSNGGRYTGDPIEDIKALGHEIDRLAAALYIIAARAEMADEYPDAEAAFRRAGEFARQVIGDLAAPGEEHLASPTKPMRPQQEDDR